MITFVTSALRGPILLIRWVLGESSFGNDSHFSKHARQQYSLRHCQAHRRRRDWTTAILLGDDLLDKTTLKGQMWTSVGCPILGLHWVWDRYLYGFGLRSWAGWKSKPWAILLTHVLGPKWAWVLWAHTLAPLWFMFGFSGTNQGTGKAAVTRTIQRAHFEMIPEINKCISQKAHCIWPSISAAIIAYRFANRGARVSYLWYS